MIIIKLIFEKLVNNTSEMLQDLKLFEHLVIKILKNKKKNPKLKRKKILKFKAFWANHFR